MLTFVNIFQPEISLILKGLAESMLAFVSLFDLNFSQHVQAASASQLPAFQTVAASLATR